MTPFPFRLRYRSPARQEARLRYLSPNGYSIALEYQFEDPRRVFAKGLHAAAAQAEIAESARSALWMHERSTAGDWDALFDHRRQAPHAEAMHPTDEYLLSWFIAAGAGGRTAVP